ncbi:hypothetical protein HB662_08530 [Roseomonas frigidaquae]|uniref:Calx-beta domain-containing protein n=1 Tax=Falsiroseomonas frigidaquae TaxID=487318 RepID=A0ABX1EXK5_9PROT|nr:hypothetical protein [Falsiroseomonas frigidaquae]
MSQRNPYWTPLQALSARAAFDTTNTFLTFSPTPWQSTHEGEAVARDAINATMGFDMMHVRLELGAAYDFRSFGNAATELAIFDSSGYLLLSFDSDDYGLSGGIDTILDFLPSYTGTHYLAIGYLGGGGGSYEVIATEDLHADGFNGPPKALTVNPVPTQRSEGDYGWTDFHVTVDRSGDLSGSVAATWRITGRGDNPADAGDFESTFGTVRFAAGESSRIITLRIKADIAVEADETFTVTLSDLTPGFLLLNATVQGTIFDDDANAILLDVFPDVPRQPEGSADGVTAISFTIQRSGGLDRAVTVPWTTIGSLDAADFVGGVAPEGILSFAPGETTQRVTVQVRADRDHEPDETVAIWLWSLPTGVHRGEVIREAIIANDDAPPPSFSLVGDTMIREGNGGGDAPRFGIRRGGDASATQTVTWTLAPWSHDYPSLDAGDFEAGVLPSGSVTFAPGETWKPITLGIRQDRVWEADEQFLLSLGEAPAGSTIQDGVVLGTVLNDDRQPARVTADFGDALREGTGSGVVARRITLTRESPLDTQSRVGWSVLGGSAPHLADAADFLNGILPSGVVVFAPGETSRTVTIRTLRDATPEQDETYQLVLQDLDTGVEMDQAWLWITDDDTPATTYTISPATSALAEGSGSGVSVHVFTVTRQGDLSEADEIAWSARGHGANPADAADFQNGVLPGGRILFAAGQSEQTLKVRVLRDLVAEADEGFAVTLAPGNGLPGATATATIRNDEPQPAAPVPRFDLALSAAVREGTGNGVVVHTATLTRDAGLDQPARIAWSAAGHGAAPVEAADFQNGVMPSGIFVFAPGEASQSVRIRTLRDREVEADESFTLQLRNLDTGAVLSPDTGGGAITLIDDDTGYRITPTSTALAEGTGVGVSVHVFTVTRLGDASAASSLTWSAAGSGANPADAADFLGGVLPGGRLVFAAGETSQTVKLRVLRDALAEADEGFLLRLPGVSATGLILDDDTARLAASTAADLHLLG